MHGKNSYMIKLHDKDEKCVNKEAQLSCTVTVGPWILDLKYIALWRALAL